MLGYFLFNIFTRALHQSCLLGAYTCDACAYELFAGGLRFKCTCGACACELFPSLHQWKLDVKILLCEMSYLSIYHFIIWFLGFAQISCMNVLVNLNLLLL